MATRQPNRSTSPSPGLDLFGGAIGLASLVPELRDILNGPIGGLLTRGFTGSIATKDLGKNRPSYTSPSRIAGPNFDFGRPLQYTPSRSAPDVRRATGGRPVTGSPSGVVEAMVGDRQRGFERAREAETESRSALDFFKRGLLSSSDKFGQISNQLDAGAASADKEFDRAATFASAIPSIVRQTTGQAMRAINSMTGAVGRAAAEARDNLGDFVVEKMESLRSGIDAQFETATKQALDNLSSLPGGGSAEERAALTRAMDLEKGRTIASAYAPVLASEGERIAQLNVDLTGIMSNTMAVAQQQVTALAGDVTNADIVSSQLRETIANNRSAMKQSYIIAKGNLATFSEQLARDGNREAFNMVQEMPRPFLVMSDIANFLMQQYYGLVESENILEQSQFADFQAILSPQLSAFNQGLTDVGNRAEAESARHSAESQSRTAATGNIISGVLGGAGNVVSGGLQAAGRVSAANIAAGGGP